MRERKKSNLRAGNDERNNQQKKNDDGKNRSRLRVNSQKPEVRTINKKMNS